jgi:hypothetical protein
MSISMRIKKFLALLKSSRIKWIEDNSDGDLVIQNNSGKRIVPCSIRVTIWPWWENLSIALILRTTDQEP